MRWFVRQSNKKSRVCASNQYQKSIFCGDILKIKSEELKVEGNVYNVFEAYMIYKNDHSKIIKKEYESKFDDYSKNWRRNGKIYH